MLLKNFSKENLNKSIGRNIARYNYNKKRQDIFKGFGPDNYFINSQSGQDYLLKDIKFDKNTSFLLIDDIGLQALIELYKLGISNVTLACSNDTILNTIKWSLKTLFEEYSTINIVLLKSILNDSYDIVINGNRKIEFNNFRYQVGISCLSYIHKYYKNLIKINSSPTKILKLGTGSNFFNYVLSKEDNERYLFKNKDEFNYNIVLNSDFRHIYQSKKEPISFSFLNQKYWDDLCLALPFRLTKLDYIPDNLFQANNTNFLDDKYNYLYSQSLIIRFKDKSSKCNFLDFYCRKMSKGLPSIIYHHYLGLLKTDILNVDWSHSWSYRELLKEYGYTDDEIVYLFNKYSWNEIGDLK